MPARFYPVTIPGVGWNILNTVQHRLGGPYGEIDHIGTFVQKKTCIKYVQKLRELFKGHIERLRFDT